MVAIEGAKTINTGAEGAGGQFRQVLHGCGKWNLPLTGPLLGSLRSRITDGSTMLVFPFAVSETDVSDADRASSIFEGYMTQVGTTFLAGWEPAYLLQTPKGHGPETPFYHRAGTLTVAGSIDHGLPINGISEGTLATDVHTVPIYFDSGGVWGSGSGGVGLTRTARTALDEMLLDFEQYVATNPVYSWRINPGLTLDVGKRDTIYRQLEAILTPSPHRGPEAGIENIPTAFNTVRSIEDVASDVEVYGEVDQADNGIESSTGSQTIPFKAPDNTDLEIRRIVNLADAGKQDALDQLRDITLGLSVVRQTTSATMFHPNIHRVLSVGDYAYVADPTIEDEANHVHHSGADYHPIKMWAKKLGWNFLPGWTAMVRTPNGADFVDVTRHIQPGTDAVSVTLSDVWAAPHLDNTPASVRLGDEPPVAARLARST